MYIKWLFPVITSGLVGTMSLNVALTTIEKENAPKNKVYYNSQIKQSLEKLDNAYNKMSWCMKNNPKSYPNEISNQFIIFYEKAYFITTKAVPFNRTLESKLIVDKIFKHLHIIHWATQHVGTHPLLRHLFARIIIDNFDLHIKVIYESIWKLGFEHTEIIME